MAELNRLGAANGAAAVGLTVRVAVRVTPAYVAVIVTGVDPATDVVVMLKLTLNCPARTLTLAGTVAAACESDSVTLRPPDGAAALRVTVPVEELPPVTLVGFTETDVSVGPVWNGWTSTWP
ncbi:hypothetical protein BH24CHL1_BH24CHL1_06170 [soil metagenome]